MLNGSNIFFLVLRLATLVFGKVGDKGDTCTIIYHCFQSINWELEQFIFLFLLDTVRKSVLKTG